VNVLIDMGANVNQKNQEGEVAAFHSVKENHPNITRILFDKGCNPDAVRNDGESLITIAYRHQNSTAVQQIIEYRPKWRATHDEDVDSADEPLIPKKMGM
jgi:ankyrin repeat protein